MDYEKKYKEALERMKLWAEGTLMPPDESPETLCAIIFPELTESEDEKIRKGLIHHLKELREWKAGTMSPIKVKEHYDVWIDYLEKQKEPHYTKRNALFDKCVANCDPEIMKKVSDEVDEKLKEQKPAEYLDLDNASQDYVYNHFCPGADLTLDYIKGLMEDAFIDGANWQKEQKPAQTDDEKEYIRTIKSLISNFIRDKQPEDVAFYQKIYDWLDGRHIEQKPEGKPINWTELTWKDIVELEGIINNVHYEFRNGIGQESFGKEVLEKFREYKGEYLDEIEQKPVEGTALQKAFISSKIDYTLEEKCDASDYAEAILPTSVVYGENEEEYKLHKIIEAAFIAGQKKEQNPTEWSDTNELVFKDICKHLKEEGYNGWIVLLEALRNGEFQPKQKWSEEDERAINCACVALRAYAHGDLPEFLPSELMGYADRLQSLRLDSYKNCNSRWKPSEEQMGALSWMLENARGNIDFDPLKDLYEQLKKLM